MKRIMLVFGTRPEAIKMCPLVKVVFTHIPQPGIKSAYYIKGYENEDKVGILSGWQDESKSTKRIYDQFDYVGWFNGGFEV